MERRVIVAPATDGGGAANVDPSRGIQQAERADSQRAHVTESPKDDQGTVGADDDRVARGVDIALERQAGEVNELEIRREREGRLYAAGGRAGVGMGSWTVEAI